MAEHPTTLDRAQGMLDYLRTLPPAVAHEEARAAIAAATTYLRERFGDVHGIATADAIVASVAEASATVQVEAPVAVLH